MKRGFQLALLAAVIFGGSGLMARAQGESRIGVGAHYWRALDDIEIEDIEEDALAWVFAYQYRPAPLIGVEADLELLPDEFAGAEERVWAPQAYLIVGSVVYAGLGIGIYYTDGEWADDPFYALRAGLDLELLPGLHLDVQANYRFEEWKNLSEVADDVDTDSVTLGVGVRLSF
jgi:hypothetical protein